MAANKYETMMLFSTTKGEEATGALVEKFTKMLEDNGTVEKTDDWGVRKLAYPINDEEQAHYILFEHTCEPACLEELQRIANITDDFMRLLFIRKD